MSLEAEAIFTVKCAGECGRESQTMRVTELWTPQYCPDCADVGCYRTGSDQTRVKQLDTHPRNVLE